MATPALPPLTSRPTLPALDPAQSAEVDATWAWLEDRARAGIAGTLRRHGLFSQAGQVHDAAEVQTRLQALPQYGRLLRQWLTMLCAHGDLRREGDTYVCLRPLQPQPETAPLPQAGWSRTLGRYLETCITRHDALLTGTQSPLALLFDDDEDIARCLYSDNPVSDCLNRSAAQLAAALAGERDDLRVLEVGAGTAATTRHLLPALAGRLHSYRFTDVSTLFLDNARLAFAGHPEVGYALFDINRPVDFAAHPDDGYDLIVAVNVLHDASHVVRSLRRLGRLLRPGGRLLLIEATERDSVLQMASIGFIESLNGYQDFRLDDDKPMLDLPQWRDALAEAGFAPELNWPDQEHSPMRQHLVLARAERLARLDTRRVERWLHAQPGIRLPALQLRQGEQLPQGEATVTAAPEPGRAAAVAQPALEARVMAVWQSLLPQQDISRDSDFFLCGGDSLIATRMVARLNRNGLHGASLQNLFAQPLLADFCATLQAPQPPAPGEGNPVLLASGRDPERLFVFHASDGELGAYLPLARHLDRQVFGLHAADAQRMDTLTALTEQHVAAIRRQQAHGPYVLQEHPLHPDDLAPLQALAAQRHLVYWVNSFYPHTPAGRCWIDRAQRVRRLLDGEAPRFAHLVTSRQLLYSSLDLLLQASGTPTATVECMPDDDPAFHTLRLRLAGNTAILRLQSYLDPGDPDLHSLVMHQLTLGWPAGYLTLEASHGPVLWTPALYDPQHRERRHSLYHAAAGPNGAPHARPTTLTVHPAPADWRQACEIDGPAGVGELLQALRRHLDGEATPAGLDAPHQLALARLWRQVLHCAGPARECSLPAPRWIGEHALLAPSVGGTTT